MLFPVSNKKSAHDKRQDKKYFQEGFLAIFYREVSYQDNFRFTVSANIA
jgi:hypothetical protein